MVFRKTVAAAAAMVERTLASMGRVFVRPRAHRKATGLTSLRRAGSFTVSRPALRVPGASLFTAGSRPLQVFGITLLFLAAAAPVVLAVPAGTIITNTATADYTVSGSPRAAVSNSVAVTTVELGSSSVLELFRYAPASPALSLTVGITPYFDGSGFTAAPAPNDPATGGSISLGSAVPLEPATSFGPGEAVFLRLVEPDGNADPAVADTLRVVVEDATASVTETLLLNETAPDSGVFTGYLRSGAAAETANDGILYGYPGSRFTARYTDPLYPPDVSTAPFTFGGPGGLWVTASAGRNTVSAGDYLTYTITLENATGSTVPGSVLTTDLPPGFRYMPGSTRLGSLASSDPLAAPDGRSLAFSTGDIPPGGTVTVTFVARVGATTRTGPTVTPNTASSGSLTSNTALVRVRVTEDLFRNSNTVVGRVLAGTCGEETGGVSGVRLFLEDGTYVVTDEKGRYHFEGVRPGTHVVQLDLETVPAMFEAVLCEEDTRQAGRPWSRFVDLAGGTFWRADFYLKPRVPEEGKAVLVLRTTAETGKVTFNATMRGEQVPLRNLRFTVTVPDGVQYEAGTARLEGESIGEPEVEGSTLTWYIGSVTGAWEKGITFETRIREGWEWLEDGTLGFGEGPGEGAGQVKQVQGRLAEVMSRARVTFDTPIQKDVSTPEVQNLLLKVSEREETITRKFVFRPHFATFEDRLTEEDQKALDIIAALFEPTSIDRVQVSGHTDDIPISERGRQVFADNYALSEARARSVARYLRGVWDLPSGIFEIEGKGPDAPVASNDTSRGRTLNRRVEVNVVTSKVQRHTDLLPMSDQSTTEIVIQGLPAGSGPGPDVFPETTQTGPGKQADPLENLGWFESSNGALAWILPGEGFYPSVPALKVAVKHKPGSTPVLTVNGVVADPLSLEGTTVNASGRAALTVWRGVRLQEGENRLEVLLSWKDGRELGRIQKDVYLAGRPVRAEVLPDRSRLVADGKQPPVVALRFTDARGRPARPGLVGQYAVDHPYRAWEKAGTVQAGGGPWDVSRGQFLIEEDGTARLPLQPTTRSGEAVLRLRMESEERTIPVWLTAQREDWILVGLAEGTVGYNAATGNMESLEDSGGDQDLYTDGRTAFFAKGRIRGAYLLTMAYDTHGPRGASGEGLAGTIDPDTYYTLYGDGTGQDYEAPTSKKLYLKIERRQFYALFGDTESGLTVTELSRYDRRFTGFRSESRGEAFSYNLFAAETEQGFVRDEIAGDGTSGLYHLSAGNLVVNSERVILEVRDRFQSHVVLSAREMIRHVDYNIDYDEGTLFFKEPIPQRDAGFNPVTVVVQYETSDPSAAGLTYGGRVGAVLPGAPVTVGISHVHEDRGNGEGDLVGADVEVGISGKTVVRMETASTSNSASGSDTDASAYILEVVHDSGALSGRAYIREQEAGFGLGHQKASEEGTRKVGGEAFYRLSESWALQAEAFRTRNLQTGGERDVEEVAASYADRRTLYTGSLRRAEDTDSDGTTESSDQVTAGVKWHSEDRRWNLSATHEQSLGDNRNTDYPTRTLLGSDYRLSEAVTLYAEQELTDGEDTSASATRAGLKATPWRGASASGTVERNTDENGERVYATTGLRQTWQVSDRWSVSAGVEAASVLGESTSEPLLEDAPPASTAEDYAAVSLGAGYTVALWDFDLRLEARSADTSDKWGLISGLSGEPGEGIGVATSLKYFRTEASGGVEEKETEASLGLVYRPLESTWFFLDRLRYALDEERGAALDITMLKLVNNFNANYRPDDQIQASFQLGTKYVKDTMGGRVYSGWTHLFGSEVRYDLNPRWDVGGAASVLTALDAGTTHYRLGASLGYGLARNMWLSFGYNLTGFEDTDFSQGDFTAQGPYVKFRLKFDQEDLKSILKQP